MNSEEVWKPIKDYEGLYEISNFGRVKNAKHNTMLKMHNKEGYQRLALHRNGKSRCVYVHRLVAETFIENHDPKKKVVDHIDRERTNNHVSNLRWATLSQNSKNRHITGGKSKYKGVTFRERNQKYEVNACFNSKHHYIGSYENEKQAAKAYNEACIKLLESDDFTMLNDISDEESISKLDGNVKRKRKNASSKFFGVSWRKDTQKWQAFVYVNGQKTNLGCFANEIDAAITYNEAACMYLGKNCLLNEIEDDDWYNELNF